MKKIFQTKKDFITCSKLIINELEHCHTRSDKIEITNIEELLAVHTAALCFGHAKHTLLEFKFQLYSTSC